MYQKSQLKEEKYSLFDSRLRSKSVSHLHKNTQDVKQIVIETHDPDFPQITILRNIPNFHQIQAITYFSQACSRLKTIKLNSTMSILKNNLISAKLKGQKWIKMTRLLARVFRQRVRDTWNKIDEGGKTFSQKKKVAKHILRIVDRQTKRQQRQCFNEIRKKSEIKGKIHISKQLSDCIQKALSLNRSVFEDTICGQLRIRLGREIEKKKSNFGIKPTPLKNKMSKEEAFSGLQSFLKVCKKIIEQLQEKKKQIWERSKQEKKHKQNYERQLKARLSKEEQIRILKKKVDGLMCSLKKIDERGSIRLKQMEGMGVAKEAVVPKKSKLKCSMQQMHGTEQLHRESYELEIKFENERLKEQIVAMIEKLQKADEKIEVIEKEKKSLEMEVREKAKGMEGSLKLESMVEKERKLEETLTSNSLLKDKLQNITGKMDEFIDQFAEKQNQVNELLEEHEMLEMENENLRGKERYHLQKIENLEMQIRELKDKNSSLSSSFTEPDAFDSYIMQKLSGFEPTPRSKRQDLIDYGKTNKIEVKRLIKLQITEISGLKRQLQEKQTLINRLMRELRQRQEENESFLKSTMESHPLEGASPRYVKGNKSRSRSVSKTSEKAGESEEKSQPVLERIKALELIIVSKQKEIATLRQNLSVQSLESLNNTVILISNLLILYSQINSTETHEEKLERSEKIYSHLCLIKEQKGQTEQQFYMRVEEYALEFMQNDIGYYRTKLMKSVIFLEEFKQKLETMINLEVERFREIASIEYHYENRSGSLQLRSAMENPENQEVLRSYGSILTVDGHESDRV